MRGMSASTGRAISGHDHLRQRLADILTTPLGSRVHRRQYGSRLFSLTDRPMNPSLMVEIIQASAEAIARWEPEFRLSRVLLDMRVPGHVSLSLEGVDLISGQPVALEGITP